MIDHLRARWVLFVRRVRAKIRKENFEHFTFRHHCRTCHRDVDGGRGLNQAGFCSLVCEAEYYGAA